MDVPWFALSPSPFSIIFYVLLTAYVARTLLQRTDVKHDKYPVAITDAILIVGFFVVILDALWVVTCAIRFGSLYPDDVLHLLTCGARDVAAAIFCYLFIGYHFKENRLKFTARTWILLAVNSWFLTLWFILSPTPAYTDWTFAIRHDYPLSIVVQSFLTSHVVGKGLVAAIVYSTLKF